MRTIWAAWKRGFGLAFENLVRLIVINLIWMAVSWLVVPLGPATLALYWWIARGMRDDDGSVKPYTAFFTGLRRFFGRGLVWFLGWVAVLGLALTGLSVWPRLLPPMGVAVAQVAWFYGLIYLAAMQPYLLEALTIAERPWGEALKLSAWQVLANPLYSHAHVLILAVVLGLGFNFATLLPIVLVAVLMAFYSVAAEDCPWKYGAPPPGRGNIEDVI